LYVAQYEIKRKQYKESYGYVELESLRVNRKEIRPGKDHCREKSCLKIIKQLTKTYNEKHAQKSENERDKFKYNLIRSKNIRREVSYPDEKRRMRTRVEASYGVGSLFPKISVHIDGIHTGCIQTLIPGLYVSGEHRRDFYRAKKKE
jgi:hypothetical protein